MIYIIYRTRLGGHSCVRANDRTSANHHHLGNPLSGFLKSEMKIGVNKTHSTEFLRDSSASDCQKMTGLPNTLQSVSSSSRIYHLHCKLIRRTVEPRRWTLPRPSPARPVSPTIAIMDRPTVNLRRRGDPIDRLMKKYRTVVGSHGAALRPTGAAARCGGRTFYSNSILLFLFGRDLRMRRPRSALTSGC